MASNRMLRSVVSQVDFDWQQNKIYGWGELVACYLGWQVARWQTQARNRKKRAAGVFLHCNLQKRRQLGDTYYLSVVTHIYENKLDIHGRRTAPFCRSATHRSTRETSFHCDVFPFAWHLSPGLVEKILTTCITAILGHGRSPIGEDRRWSAK